MPFHWSFAGAALASACVVRFAASQPLAVPRPSDAVSTLDSVASPLVTTP